MKVMAVMQVFWLAIREEPDISLQTKKTDLNSPE